VLLWDIARVTGAETRAEFIAYQEQRRKRSAVAAKTAERKREKLLAAIKQMPITVERHPPDNVLEAGRRDWENWQANRRNDYGASGRDTPLETPQRWAVNFIRHNLTSYNGRLATIGGKLGVADAAQRIRQRVLEKIAEVYPEFAEECDRQIRHRQSCARSGHSRGPWARIFPSTTTLSWQPWKST
jgi:hypothetical protein